MHCNGQILRYLLVVLDWVVLFGRIKPVHRKAGELRSAAPLLTIYFGKVYLVTQKTVGDLSIGTKLCALWLFRFS